MRRSLAIAFLLLVSSISGCASGAEWADVRREFNYHPPVGLTFVIVPRSQGQDFDLAMQHLVTALTKGLADQGLPSRASPYPVPPPVLFLDIVEWDPGNRFLRWWGFGGGEAHVVIDARLVQAADGRPALTGRVTGFVRGGSFGGSAMDAPEIAAESISRFVATGAAPSEQ